MKQIATYAAGFVFILVLTKIANQAPQEPEQGRAFWLTAQHVVQCSPGEITLVDGHRKATHLEKDGTWPDCAVFGQGEVLDFNLFRGDETRLIRYEKTAGWRRIL